MLIKTICARKRLRREASMIEEMREKEKVGGFDRLWVKGAESRIDPSKI